MGGASCHGASWPEGELSWGEVTWGRIVQAGGSCLEGELSLGRIVYQSFLRIIDELNYIIAQRLSVFQYQTLYAMQFYTNLSLDARSANRNSSVTALTKG